MEQDSEPGAPRARPRRWLPRFHWELLSCGIGGHLLYGTDAAELRRSDHVFVREGEGVRWHRCLRCDSWIPLPPPSEPSRRFPPDREEISLPLRGRPLRDKVILRLIAVDKSLRFLLFASMAVIVFEIAAHETGVRDLFYRVLGDFRGSSEVPQRGLLHEFDKLLSLRSGTLHLVGAGVAAYALLQAIEAVGLWMTKRWAEYLTVVSTAAFIPLEIWELTISRTPLKVALMGLNLGILAYLLWAKRLFGIRGGGAADEALKARDVGWEALESAAPEAPRGVTVRHHHRNQE